MAGFYKSSDSGVPYEINGIVDKSKYFWYNKHR